MKRSPGNPLSRKQVQPAVHLFECTPESLLIFLVVGHHPPQVLRQKPADADSALGGEFSCPLEQILLDSERDVVLHDLFLP
jgi:hypothetical protein